MQRNTCGQISAPFLRESQAGLLSSEKLQARIISDSTNVHTDSVNEYQVEGDCSKAHRTQLNRTQCTVAQVWSQMHKQAQICTAQHSLQQINSGLAEVHFQTSTRPFAICWDHCWGMPFVLATGIPTFCLLAANVSVASCTHTE